MSLEASYALQLVGACVGCWFLGYGSGAVVRTVRRIVGNAAR